MNENKITPSASGRHQIEITRTQSDSRERITLIVCVTVVISLLCIALIIVLCRVDHSGKDYAAILLPIVSGSVFGLLGFRAGAKSAGKDS
jgi:hypothetical protein